MSNIKERYAGISVDQPLTMKQQLFVEAYFANDYNGSEAARVAGYTGTNHNKIANQLMNKPNVRAAIDARAKKKLEEIALTEEYVVRKLVKTIEKAEKDNNLTAVLRGIELAAKNLGMLRDRTEISGPDGDAIKYEEVQREADEFTRKLMNLPKKPDLKLVENE